MGNKLKRLAEQVPQRISMASLDARDYYGLSTELSERRPKDYRRE